MKKHLLYWLAAVTIISFGCQKELSFEGSNTPAEGSLGFDLMGDCLPKTVNGTYVAAVALVPATNTINVQVNVTKTGTYVVGTDTVNGYFFRATGTFTTLGANSVTLRGFGTPFVAGINNFVVSFDSTFCDIQVTVTSPGIGTLGGAPTACTPITVNGGYSPGVALTASNNAIVQVDVTTAGLINITTDTVAGIWFTFSGSLSVGAGQNVTLQAQGSIPAATTPGPKIFTVRLGTSSCTFVVNINSPAAGTVNCSAAVINGSYTAGTALNSSNTVQISVTVTTIGAYNITTDTMNGIWFNASGNFTMSTTQPLTLVGNGTPVNAGTFTFTVRFGTSTCTFVVNCLPAPLNDYFPRTINSNWSYEWNDDMSDSLYRTVITPTITALGNVFNIFMPNDGGGLDSTGNYPAGYYRKSGGDYYEWFDYGSFIGYDNPGWAQYIMLKDNVPALTNWKSTGFSGTVTPPGTTFNIRFSYTILLKDVPVSITTSTGTANYTNVIVVEEKYELETTPGNWQDMTSTVGYGKSYYARGIGLIKYEAFDNTLTLTDWMELRRYQIL